jgi:hypothetical protein
MKTSLLPLIPAAIIAVLLLPAALFLGNGALSLVAGPVNTWNTPWRAPGATEIAGYYRISKENNRAPEGTVLPEHAAITLGADHRLEIIDVPAFDGLGARLDCNYGGAGKWDFRGTNLFLSIDTVSPARPEDRPVCDPTSLSGVFEVLGHSRPYRLWYYIGDPDSWQGLTFELKNP